MKNKIIFVPENLDLEKIINQNPPEFEFNINYAYTIIYDIIKTSYGKFSKIKNWAEFYNKKPVKNFMISKCSTNLQKQKHDYKQHFEYLYKNNILWRGQYSEGICRTFQLAPDYFGHKLKFICLTGYNNLKFIPNKNSNIEAFKPFSNWFNSRLAIDENCALKSLNDGFNEHSNYYDYIRNFNLVSSFYNGIYNFSRKEYTDNRLHSNFTVFPKSFRRCLNFDGIRLGEVDISSSVPFFIYYHMLAIVDITKINKIYYDKFFQNHPLYSNALRITKDKVQLDELEVQRYGTAVLNGTFYKQFVNNFDDEYYMKNSIEILNRDFDGSDSDKEKILKNRILRYINSKMKSYKAEQEVFKSFYPTIYKFISVFKTRRYIPKTGILRKKAEKIESNNRINSKEAFQQHKKVSHFLLQTESFFVLDITARRLNKKHSKVPFFTLHDCIITTENNLMFLKKFMTETLQDVMGFSPNFKEKIFT